MILGLPVCVRSILEDCLDRVKRGIGVRNVEVFEIVKKKEAALICREYKLYGKEDRQLLRRPAKGTHILFILALHSYDAFVCKVGWPEIQQPPIAQTPSASESKH